MKNLLFVSFLAAMLLFSGQAFAAEKCCVKSPCSCVQGTCCKDGNCTCTGDCCSQGVCKCGTASACKDCSCSKQ